MLLKHQSGCLGEVIGRLCGGLELLEQGQRLAAHSRLHHGQLMQPGAAEDGLEPNAGGSNSALPTGTPQRSLQLWTSQAGRLSWSRCDRQHSTGIRMRQATRTAALEGFHKRGVVLAQQGAELVGDLLSVPDGILLSASEHGDGLSQFRVGWQGPMRGPVGAQNVGQQLSVDPVRLCPRHAMPLTIPCHRQRIDRVHLSSGATQTRHHQTARCLNGDRNGLDLVVAVLGQEREQQLIAEGVVIDPPLRQHHTGLVDQCHVIVIFRPVNPTDTGTGSILPRMGK
jgi:hypothetical protein